MTPMICIVVHLALWPFHTVQNRRSTVIEVQYYVYLSITSCSRQELNECLTDRYVFAYVEVGSCEVSVSRLARLLRVEIHNRRRTNPCLALSNFSQRQS